MLRTRFAGEGNGFHEDVRRVSDLLQLIYKIESGEVPQTLEDHTSSRNIGCVALTEESKTGPVLSTAAYYPYPPNSERIQNELTGRIYSVATHPDYRRQGLGERTLAYLLERAAGGGLHSICLEVRESNRSAISLYRKLGFSKIGSALFIGLETHEHGLIMGKVFTYNQVEKS